MVFCHLLKSLEVLAILLSITVKSQGSQLWKRRNELMWICWPRSDCSIDTLKSFRRADKPCQTKTCNLLFPIHFAERFFFCQWNYHCRAHIIFPVFSKTDVVHCHYRSLTDFCMLPSFGSGWGARPLSQSVCHEERVQHYSQAAENMNFSLVASCCWPLVRMMHWTLIRVSYLTSQILWSRLQTFKLSDLYAGTFELTWYNAQWSLSYVRLYKWITIPSWPLRVDMT